MAEGRKESHSLARLNPGEKKGKPEDYGAIQISDTSGLIENMEPSMKIDESFEDRPMRLPLDTDPKDNQWKMKCSFRDGKRQIDFMLVEEKDTMSKTERAALSKANQRKRETERISRQTFKANLRKAGIEMEETEAESGKKVLIYTKLHVSWETMCSQAEGLGLRSPLQINPKVSHNWSQKVLDKLCCHRNIMELDVPNKPARYFTGPFKESRITKFIGYEDHETFFSSRDRMRVAYELLCRTPYGSEERAEIGVEQLIDGNIFLAAYPLHDGPYKVPNADDSKDDKSTNNRQILYKFWARWGRWYKYQPISHIREYFGEKIAIYFAWLGFYTAWLLPASLLGVLIFIINIPLGQDTAVNEACNSGHEYEMCPICAKCDSTYLSNSCLYIRLAGILDTPATVFFAIFMSLWAVTFLEFWKRTSSTLAYDWDCTDIVEEEEPPRPAFAKKCRNFEENPVTGVQEPAFPKQQRLRRMIAGISVIVLMILVVIICIFGVIIYRVLIAMLMAPSKTESAASLMGLVKQLFGTVTAAVLNLIIIMILGKLYEKLAYILTEWEMHRTQSEFEDNLIFKIFIFQFVNFYSAIIYAAFFKGKFSGIPGHYNKIFGLRQEECQQGGCLIEVAILMVVIMIVKQILNNIMEILVPKLKALIQKYKTGHKISDEDTTRWEEDYALIQNEGLISEYMEMVIQFGFITIFVAAFPIAPLFAWINNWIEIRLDAQKFIRETRRPVAERCQDIGIWFTILSTLSQLAVISNAFLIAFTSEFLPKQLYKYKHDGNLDGYLNFSLAVAAPNSTAAAPCRYNSFRDENGEPLTFFWELIGVRLAFVIIFEHAVFSICKLIDLLVPDIPESVDFKVKRERYLARQALMESQ